MNKCMEREWAARTKAADRIQQAFDEAQLQKRTKEQERAYVRDAYQALNE